MGQSLSQNTGNRNERNEDNDVTNFVQSVFNDNSGLGYVPVRLDINGDAVINPVYIKKTEPRVLPFDIIDHSLKIVKNEKGEFGVFELEFSFDTTTDITIEVFLKVKEKRIENGKNIEILFFDENQKFVLKYGKGLD